MSANDKRTGEVDLMSALNAAMTGASAPFEGWTDEQWSAYEVVSPPKTGDSAAVIPLRQDPDLVSRGWPLRAVLAAKQADASRDAIRALESVSFADRNIVVLAGDPGCGKTVAAARWALQSTKHSARCQFVRAATFAASSRYDSATRERWYSAHALVLDDLGAEYLDAKGSFLVDLDELIDTFYGVMRALVITTNLRVEDTLGKPGSGFKSRYGERVIDRIRECGVWLDVAAPSMRGKETK